MNWFEQIVFQAKLSPDEPAVVFPGGMATYVLWRNASKPPPNMF